MCGEGSPKPCDDGNACTLDQCVKGSCLSAPKAGNCTTGNPCDAAGLCEAGACKGVAKVCDDADPCTADTCDAATGGCAFKPAPCQLPACATSTDCPAAKHCDPKLNVCVACTAHAHCPATAPVCKVGACVAGLLCKSDAVCGAIKQVCDVAAGACAACASDLDCGPKMACLAGACKPKPPCASSLECAKVCHKPSGVCGDCAVDADCPVDHWCGADLTCRPALCLAGACGAKGFFACQGGKGFAAPQSCSDGKPCTQDVCDAGKGCSNPTMPNGTPCTDGSACPLVGCQAGACTSLPLSGEATFTLGGSEQFSAIYPSNDGGVIGLGHALDAQKALRPVVFALSASGKLLWLHSPQLTAAGGWQRWNPDGSGGLWAVRSTQVGPGQAAYTIVHVDSSGAVVTAPAPTAEAVHGVAGDTKSVSIAYTSPVDVTVRIRRYLADGSLTDSMVSLVPDKQGWPYAVYGLVRSGPAVVAVGIKADDADGGMKKPYLAAFDANTLQQLKFAYDTSYGQGLQSPVALADGGIAARIYVAGEFQVRRYDASLGKVWTSTPGVGGSGQLFDAGSAGVGFIADPSAGGVTTQAALVKFLDKGAVAATLQVGSAYLGALTTAAATPSGLVLVGSRTYGGGWFARPDPLGKLACPCVAEGKPIGVCDDGKPCTLDACDAKAGCAFTPLPAGAPCSDGNPYTAGTACGAFGCGGGCKQVQVANADSKQPGAFGVDAAGNARFVISSPQGVRAVTIKADGSQQTGGVVMQDLYTAPQLRADGSWLIADIKDGKFRVVQTNPATDHSDGMVWNNTPYEGNWSTYRAGCSQGGVIRLYGYHFSAKMVQMRVSNMAGTWDIGKLTGDFSLPDRLALPDGCDDYVFCRPGPDAGLAATDVVVTRTGAIGGGYSVTVPVGGGVSWWRCAPVAGSADAIVVTQGASGLVTWHYVSAAGKVAFSQTGGASWTQVIVANYGGALVAAGFLANSGADPPHTALWKFDAKGAGTLVGKLAGVDPIVPPYASALRLVGGAWVVAGQTGWKVEAIKGYVAARWAFDASGAPVCGNP